MNDRPITQVLGQPGRRCGACGALSKDGRCQDCGARVSPRQKIGVLNGVGQNFGTVNNVYNLGGETEIVDLRDIQDSLNSRFPERCPPPPAPGEAQDVRLLPAPRTPSKLVRVVNPISYVLFAVFAALMAVAACAVLT